MKNLWKVLFTGALCLLALGGISVLGFVVWKHVPLLSAAAVVADFGIVFGFYKVVLDTVKAANDLEKVGLENQKLRLEIAEKRAAAEKADAYVVVATMEQIQAYAATPATARSSRFSGGLMAGGGAAFLVLIGVLSTTFAARYWVAQQPHPVVVPFKALAPYPSAGAMGPPKRPEIRASCNDGTLLVDARGYIEFSTKRTDERNLTLKISMQVGNMALPLTYLGTRGEARIFLEMTPATQIPSLSQIEIQDPKGGIIAKCRFAEPIDYKSLEEERLKREEFAEEWLMKMQP